MELPKTKNEEKSKDEGKKAGNRFAKFVKSDFHDRSSYKIVSYDDLRKIKKIIRIPTVLMYIFMLLYALLGVKYLIWPCMAFEASFVEDKTGLFYFAQQSFKAVSEFFYNLITPLLKESYAKSFATVEQVRNAFVLYDVVCILSFVFIVIFCFFILFFLSSMYDYKSCMISSGLCFLFSCAFFLAVHVDALSFLMVIFSLIVFICAIYCYKRIGSIRLERAHTKIVSKLAGVEAQRDASVKEDYIV